MHHSIKKTFLNVVLAAGVAIGSLLPLASRAAPAPYPFSVSSQDKRAPAINSFQAESRTFRVSFLDGTNASDIGTSPVFMGWATSAYANTYVTASWAKVVGATNAVDFTFSASDFNTNGTFVYFVGAGSTYKQGALSLSPNPWSTGVSAPTFSSNINFDLYTVSGGPFIYSNMLGNGFSYNPGTEQWEASSASAIPLDARAATNTVDLSSNLVDNVSALQFTGGTGDQGMMSWNADEESIDVVLNGETSPLFQTFHWHVRADGTNITKGQVVYASGTVGNSGRVKVKPYIANGSLPAHLILGVAGEDIADGEDGKVTSEGKVRGIPVTFPEETVLYPSPTVEGGLTATKPTGTNVATEIAFAVTSNAVNGVLAVRVHPHNENEFTTDAELATAQADASNKFVNVAGDTMTGPLEIGSYIDLHNIGNTGARFGVTNRTHFVIKTVDSSAKASTLQGVGDSSNIWFYAGSFAIPSTGQTATYLRLMKNFDELSGQSNYPTNLFEVYGDSHFEGTIYQRPTNNAYLGVVTATSLAGDGSGVTNVNAATLEGNTAQEVADLPRSTANFDYTTLTWSPTVTLSRATGNRQYIVTQGPTWFSVPAGATNQGYTIRLDVEQTTNEINFLPANLLISTNLFTYTNRTMSFLLDNSFNESGVALYSLPRSSE